MHFNDGTGVLGTVEEYVAFAGPRTPLLDDLDADGDLDLAYVQTADRKVSVRKNAANSLAVGDLNEDGEPDLVMACNGATPGLSVLLSNP